MLFIKSLLRFSLTGELNLIRMFEVEPDFQDLSYGSCHSLTIELSGESSLPVYVSRLLFAAQLNRYAAQFSSSGIGRKIVYLLCHLSIIKIFGLRLEVAIL